MWRGCNFPYLSTFTLTSATTPVSSHAAVVRGRNGKLSCALLCEKSLERYTNFKRRSSRVFNMWTSEKPIFLLLASFRESRFKDKAAAAAVAALQKSEEYFLVFTQGLKVSSRGVRFRINAATADEVCIWVLVSNLLGC